MAILLLFFDGIGIGSDDEDVNPFARFPAQYFSAFRDGDPPLLPFDGRMTPVDPRMDMPGLPQSATGQTALLTGTNAAKVLGRHHPGFPTVSLRKVLAAESIFLKLQKMGKTGTFANAFTLEYFERSPRSISATTWSLRASDFPFRFIDPDLMQGMAVTHDLCNELCLTLGYDVPLCTPEQSAETLARIIATVDFCLFEYFLTDRIGHIQDFVQAKREIEKLERFLNRLLSVLNLGQDTVLLTSDHGNFEDLATPAHTRNFVPCLAWGKWQERLLSQVERIENVAGAILHCLSHSPESP